MAKPIKRFRALLSCDTHPVDTLHEVSLQYKIHEQNRQDTEHGSRHADGLVESDRPAGLRLGIAVIVCRELLQLYHQCGPFGLGHDTGHIHPGQIRVVPVPHKGEQEHRKYCRSRGGQRDPHKGLKIPRAVDLSRLYQHLGHLLEELIKDQDKDGGIDTLGQQRGHHKSPQRTEYLQVRVQHIGGDHRYLAGQDKGKNDNAHHDLFAGKLKSCQSVAHDGAGQHIQQRGNARYDDAQAQYRPEVHAGTGLGVVFEVKAAGDPVDGGIQQIVQRHQGAAEHV